jgi:ribosome-binding factor A
MTSRRLLKAAEAIREVVSMAILTQLKDPRVRDVTVTHVEVTPDMRQAKVHVSVMGSEAKQKLALHGLQRSAGFLQAKINERIETRYTPRLSFYLDQGVKKLADIARILKEVLPADAESETKDAPDSGEFEDDDFEPENAADGEAGDEDETEDENDDDPARE